MSCWASLDVCDRELEGFVDEAVSILGMNPDLSDGRIERIRIGMEAQINKLM